MQTSLLLLSSIKNQNRHGYLEHFRSWNRYQTCLLKKMYVFLLLNRVLFSFCESFSNEGVSTTASPQKALSHGVVEVQDQIQVQDIKKIVIKYTGDTYAKYFLSRF